MTTPAPPEAVEAAAEAIARELMSGKDYSMAIDSDEALATAALEAAAGVLRAQGAAAERDRIIDLAVEVGAVYASESPDGEVDANVPFDTLLRGEP